jgi:hypothetical protein
MARRRTTRPAPPRRMPFTKILALCDCRWAWRAPSPAAAQQALAAHQAQRGDPRCVGGLIVVTTDAPMDEAFQRLMEEMGLKEAHE